MNKHGAGLFTKMISTIVASQMVLCVAFAGNNNDEKGPKTPPGKNQTLPQVQEENPFAKDPLVQTDSLKSFQELIEIPFLNSIYVNMLNMYLRTQSDLIMAQYFAKDPFFNNPQIKSKLYQIAVDNVNQSILTGNASMQRVTPETNPKLYKEFNEVATTLAYTKQERAEAYVFRAMGPVNAAATSIFPDRISFYIFDGLEKISDPYQREGVMGHELSHVRFKHILKGIQNTIMLLQVAGKFTKMGPPTRQMLERLKDFENNRSDLSPVEHDFWTTVFNSVQIKSETGSSDAFNQVQRINRGTFVSALEAVTDSFEAAPDMGNGAIKSYLQSLITALSTLPVEPGLIEYFKDLYFDLAKSEKNKTPLRKLDAEELLSKVQLVISNLSQGDETSADNGGIITHNAKRVASMDLAFTGADFDPESSGLSGLARFEILKRVEQSTINQLADITGMLTPDEFASFMSGNPNQTHPFGRYRWLNMIMRSRQPEVLALSNHFLRNYLIYDFLNTQAQTIKMALDDRLRDTQSKPTKDDQAFVVKMTEYQKMNEQAASFVEKRILQLVNDPKLSLEAVNPRLTNILDYLLATKEADAQKREYLIGQAKTDAERTAINGEFGRQWTMKDSALLKALREQLTQTKAKAKSPNVIEKRLNYINLISDNSSTFEQLAKARHELLSDTKSIDRQYRTPWDLKIVLKPTNQSPAKGNESKVSENAVKPSDDGDGTSKFLSFDLPYNAGKLVNVRQRSDIVRSDRNIKTLQAQCAGPLGSF